MTPETSSMPGRQPAIRRAQLLDVVMHQLRVQGFLHQEQPGSAVAPTQQPAGEAAEARLKTTKGAQHLGAAALTLRARQLLSQQEASPGAEPTEL